MPDTTLFRAAALDAQRIQWHGDIVMTQPLSYRFLAMVAAVIGCSVLAFGFFGSYTKRTTIAGQITPNLGLVKLYVQQPGIVLEKHVVEGQHVNKDDVLFVLSGERQSNTMGATQAVISDQTKLRQQSLKEQFGKTEVMFRLDRDALEKKITMFGDELPELDKLIAGQRNRVALAEESFDHYQQLTGKGFISHDQLVQKEADMLDQRGRLDSLERDLIATRRNLRDAQSQLEILPLKYDSQLSDLKRNIASAEQELSESEARRQLVVIATENGTATAVTASVGQVVDGNKPLVAIVPEGASWQAQLFAPSRAIGFVKPGDSVRIRYQSFPYQKFGQYTGKVESIATTALSSSELTGTNVFAGTSTPGGEPLYRISVNLDSQTITAYGKQQPLEAGMLLDADVLQETRRLYEWVLEPLYSLSGKL